MADVSRFRPRPAEPDATERNPELLDAGRLVDQDPANPDRAPWSLTTVTSDMTGGAQPLDLERDPVVLVMPMDASIATAGPAPPGPP